MLKKYGVSDVKVLWKRYKNKQGLGMSRGRISANTWGISENRVKVTDMSIFMHH